MKKFQFRFEAVLKVRKIKQDEALRAVAFHEKVYRQEIEKKATLLTELDLAYKRIESFSEKSSQISIYQSEQDFIEGTKQRIIQADHAILKARRNLDKVLRLFTAARAQSQVMETLKDNAHKEYRKDIERREQKLMDDLTLMRFRPQQEDQS